MHFQIGAHPAFYYPDYDTETTDRGYFGFDQTEGLHYILISEKGWAAPDKEDLLELTDGQMCIRDSTTDRVMNYFYGARALNEVFYLCLLYTSRCV